MRISDLPLISEIIEKYTELRKSGKSRAKASAELCASYEEELTVGTEDDALLFWIGLADAQVSHGELTRKAAEQGLRAIDSLEHILNDICTEDIAFRKKNYSKAPMPEQKNQRACNGFRCNWKVGDTFAYCLTGEQADIAGVSGQYVLFRKLSEMVFGKGKVYPVVSISLCPDLPLPEDSLSFAKCPFLKLDRGKMGNPRDMFEYRTELIIESEEQLASIPFVYLGNFLDVSMPPNEVVIDHPGKIVMTNLNALDKEIALYVKKSGLYDKELEAGFNG